MGWGLFHTAYILTLVGVKGRIQTRNIELDEEERRQVVEVVAEKITFLSSKRKEEELS